MGVTASSSLSNAQIAMVNAARFTMAHNAVWTMLVTKLILAKGEKSQYIYKFGGATAIDLTDGVDMTEAQSLTIAGSTVTTDEAGLKVIITRKLADQLNTDAAAAGGTIIGSAMAKKIDTDGLALFSGLDTALGAAASTLTLGHHAAAVAQCMGQSEPVPMPLVAVYHPYQINAFVDALATPGTNNMPPNVEEEYLRNWWKGNEKLYGTPIYSDGNISIDSSSGAYGAIFNKLAFVYLVGWEPLNWMIYDDSARAWEIGIVADYGVAEADGTYGRAMYFNAAIPTT